MQRRKFSIMPQSNFIEIFRLQNTKSRSNRTENPNSLHNRQRLPMLLFAISIALFPAPKRLMENLDRDIEQHFMRVRQWTNRVDTTDLMIDGS
jgi:hypothetical protein